MVPPAAPEHPGIQARSAGLGLPTSQVPPADAEVAACFPARDAGEMRARGRLLSSLLCPGDVVLLEGDLGAGKTTFVQGVAEALGVEEAVTSPTFVLARPYACARGPGAESASGIDTLWHADVYRLEHLREVWDLDLAELVDEDAVAFVEWGDRAAPALGADALRVLIEVTSTASSVGDHPERSVSFVAARGSSWAERLEKLDSDRGLPAASGAQPERGGQPGC